MPVSDNPFRATTLGEAHTSALLDALPTPKLVGQVRFLRHESRHDPDAYSRWWRSKQFSEGRRALVRRGLSPDACVPPAVTDERRGAAGARRRCARLP